jgi:nitrile hydratase
LTAAGGRAGTREIQMAKSGNDSHAHQDPDHDHQAIPSDLTLRVKALESLLVEKGLVDRAALDVIVDAFETKIGPRNGARVVPTHASS